MGKITDVVTSDVVDTDTNTESGAFSDTKTTSCIKTLTITVSQQDVSTC